MNVREISFAFRKLIVATLLINLFPVSVSGMIDNPIRTDIEAGNELLWNLSLTYTFNNEYVEK